MEFKELTEERRKVRELCRKHTPSLYAFKYSKGPSFKIDWDAKEQDGDEVHHLTSTATCIESLQDCHSTLQQTGSSQHFPNAAKISSAIALLRLDFCSGALKRKEWLSEESAPVYCACRALPLLLSEPRQRWTDRHAALVASIYKQIE